MVPLSLLLAALALSVHAYDIRRVKPATIGVVETETIPAAQYSVSFTEKVARSAYKKDLFNALSGSNALNYSAVLDGSNSDNEYLTDITIGGQNFKVIVDTGS